LPVLCENKIDLKSSGSRLPSVPGDRLDDASTAIRPQDLAGLLPSSLIAAAMNLYLQLLLLTVSGWINRRQQSVLEYLQAENRALREQLGPKRIRGALYNLGHDVFRNTVKRILLERGLEPGPERGRHTSWATFLRAHMGAIAGANFFTVEVKPHAVA